MLTRQKIRIILMGLIFAISLGVVIVIFTHQRLEEKEDIIADVEVKADASLNNFTYTQIENSKPKWDLEAEHGTHDAQQNVTNLVNIHAEFFGDTPNTSLTMTADTARAWLDDERIEARGNVIVTTASGYRLTTDVLEYSKKSVDDGSSQANSGGGIISTDEAVDFETDTMRLQGVGMTYFIEPRVLKIHHKVSARVLPEVKSAPPR
jgi:LPS export ABC transporter protein LptC